MTNAIDIANATVGYGAPEPALVGVSLTVARGELVGILGPSGSGKTTLLRLLTGRVRRSTGSVSVLGTPVRHARMPPAVGFVPQLSTVDQQFPLTVEQFVLFGLADVSKPTPWFTRNEKAKARGMLEQLGIGGLADRMIRELSGGQYQRMFLARAMVRRSELILLDEPTSGVDMQTRREILQLLGELNADGLTIVLTTHDLNWVAAHLPRVVCLNRRVIADGRPSEIFTSAVMGLTYGAALRVYRDGDVLLLADPSSPLADRVKR